MTSLGRGSLADMTPLPDEWRCLKAGIVCVDSNYSPPETELMRQVRRAGGHASNGIEMLLNQGARSFELWTGLTAPIYAMRAALGSA